MIILKTIDKGVCTIGTLTLPDGREIATLERPWLKNQVGFSCIPSGVYTVNRDHTGKHQYYRFKNTEVSPRSDIEIHPANYVHQLQGCIAPCMSVRHTGDQWIAKDSKKACDLLVDWFGEDSWVIKIERDVDTSDNANEAV